MRNFILLLILLFSSIGFTQSINHESIGKNPRTYKTKGYGIQLGGPTIIISGYYNKFINHQLNFELGGGLFGVYGGAKYYAGKKDNKQLLSPYIGANLGLNYLPYIRIFFDGSSSAAGWSSSISFYAPAGIQLMTKTGFHLSIETALVLATQFDPHLWVAFKYGKNF
jgi:hypothetical protein